MSAMPAKKNGANSEAKKTDAKAKKSAKSKMRLIKGGARPKAKGLSELERSEMVLEFRVKARKLSRSILRKWHARMDLEEVDSIVDLSLCEAVKRYDPTKGASFMTFLYYHLRGNLIRSVSSAASANTIPCLETEIDAKSSEQAQWSVNATDIADALCSNDNVLPDEALFKKELINLSHEACARLDELEREVIYRIYLEGQQLIDIANSLGYSRCHISRVKKKALETLNDDVNHHLELDNSEDENEIFERRKVFRRRPRSKQAQEQNEDLVVNG